MGSPKLGILVAVAGVIGAILLFVVLSGDGGEESPTPAATSEPTTPAGSDGPSGNGNQGSGEKPEPDKPEKPQRPEVAVIEIEGGQPVGGVQELSFERGEPIRFTVRSDVADHVHLHGYDVFQDVSAGGEASFDVPAEIEGVFEVELEDRVVPIAEITVTPG